MAGKKGQAPRVEFSQEKFDEICGHLEDGKTLRGTCEMAGMPDRKTFHNWCKRNPELQAQYDAAYREGERAIQDDVRYIAETVKDAPVARNMMDASKWDLMIRNRKKYGNQVTGEITGANGGPIQLVLNGSDVHG